MRKVVRHITERLVGTLNRLNQKVALAVTLFVLDQPGK